MWIAYVLWVAFFGVLAYVVTLLIAAQVFGISLFCLFGETSGTADTYRNGVGLSLLIVGLALAAAGTRLARRSATRLAMAPLAAFAAVILCSTIAAAIVGEQPCMDDGSYFGP